MMKKLTAMLLALVLVLGMMTGCSNQTEQESSSQTDQSSETKEESAQTSETEVPVEEASADETSAADEESSEAKWDGEVEKIVMTFIHGGTDNTFVEQMSEVLNDYIRDKIGVEVEFRQVSVFDAPSQYTMWVAGGEEVDIMGCAFTGITPYIAMNMLEPMDGLLEENAPDIARQLEEKIIDGAKGTDGQIYGLSVGTEATAGTLCVFTDALEETGLEYENYQIITMDDADKIAKAVKENHPECYMPMSGSVSRSGMTFVNDPLGATASSGVLVGLDSTEVVNYYETEEYQKYLEVVRGWYNLGLIKQDAATTDATEAGTMATDPDNALLQWVDFDMGLIENFELQSGKDITTLLLEEPYKTATTPSGTCYWTIPVTAQHPEAAMRFLNLMYTDSYVSNTIVYGVEGVNYEFVNEEKTAIVRDYAENNYFSLSIYICGETEIWSEGEKSEERVQMEAWKTESMLNNVTKGFGFCYDGTNMTNQITAIDAVVAEYVGALETGSADLETVYPEFIEKLKANGIDDVIADKQQQFNDWLAAN